MESQLHSSRDIQRSPVKVPPSIFRRHRLRYQPMAVRSASVLQKAPEAERDQYVPVLSGGRKLSGCGHQTWKSFFKSFSIDLSAHRRERARISVTKVYQ